MTLRARHGREDRWSDLTALWRFASARALRSMARHFGHLYELCRADGLTFSNEWILPKGDVTVEKVGFVGAAMAGNLLRTGHELVVHNRTETKSALQNPSTASD